MEKTFYFGVRFTNRILNPFKVGFLEELRGDQFVALELVVQKEGLQSVAVWITRRIY